MPLQSDEVGGDPLIAAVLVAAVLQNLLEGAGIGGREKECAYSLVERATCRVRSGAAAQDIQRHGVGHVLAPLFPDVYGRLQMHAASLAGCPCQETKSTVAEEMFPLFEAQDVHREALAALRLFQEAARREEVTAELVQELAVYFRDARVDPSLRFR